MKRILFLPAGVVLLAFAFFIYGCGKETAPPKATQETQQNTALPATPAEKAEKAAPTVQESAPTPATKSPDAVPESIADTNAKDTSVPGNKGETDYTWRAKKERSPSPTPLTKR